MKKQNNIILSAYKNKLAQSDLLELAVYKSVYEFYPKILIPKNITPQELIDYLDHLFSIPSSYKDRRFPLNLNLKKQIEKFYLTEKNIIKKIRYDAKEILSNRLNKKIESTTIITDIVRYLPSFKSKFWDHLERIFGKDIKKKIEKTKSSHRAINYLKDLDDLIEETLTTENTSIEYKLKVQKLREKRNYENGQ